LSKVEFNSLSNPIFRCDFINQYHINILLRADLDLNVYGPAISSGIKSKDVVLLKEIPAMDWIKPLSEKIQGEFVDVRRTINLLESDISSIGALVRYSEGQNYLKIKPKLPCAVSPKSVNERDLKFGYRVSNEITTRFGFNKKVEFQSSIDSIEGLWQKIQTNECNVSFITGEEFKRIRKVLEEDKKFNYRLEVGFNQKQSLLSFIQFKGYKSLYDYDFANRFNPPLQPDQIQQLAIFAIDSYDKVELAFKRMLDTNYQKSPVGDIRSLFIFLNDEAAGKKLGLSPESYREKRMAEAEDIRIKQQMRLAKAQADRANRSFTLGVVCLGNDSARSFIENIIQMYASNTHVAAISNYVTSLPGCLFPRQNSPISGAKLEEFFRLGRFVGVRTINTANGQHIYGMLTTHDWDMQNR
jgi:hypothetical protein